MRENEMIIECCHDSFAKTNIIHVVVVVFIIEQTCDLELFPLALNASSICWKANFNFRQKMQVCIVAVIQNLTLLGKKAFPKLKSIRR